VSDIAVQAFVSETLEEGVVHPVTGDDHGKLNGGLWTSTWTGTTTYSDWVRWIVKEGGGFGGPRNVLLLTPDLSAMVFVIDSAETLWELHRSYPNAAGIDWVR
jgi:hypothetical protein